MSAYYQMTEDQEFAVYEARNAMSGLLSLIDSVPPDKTITLNPAEVSALLSILKDRLPKSEDMQFVVE